MPTVTFMRGEVTLIAMLTHRRAAGCLFEAPHASGYTIVADATSP